MAVSLYDSSICRLCGEENDGGNLLFLLEENNTPLCDVINSYLPIKVTDDKQLPRSICPGCTIQTEATVEFFNLISDGQKILRDLLKKEKEFIKYNASRQNEITPDVPEIQKDNAAFSDDHPLALKVAGLERPKRKRGRPPKKIKTPEELEKEQLEKQLEVTCKNTVENEEPSGKRRRKTPTRFKEVVQGKELERIFIEEGVTDGETDSEEDPKSKLPKEPEVIGHMETSGELVVVVKGKGRGRPKGSNRNNREECAICGMTFSCVGRYMSHVAQHGPVMYQCAQCAENFGTRLDFNSHQMETGHSGQNVIQCKLETQEVATTEEQDPLGGPDNTKPESEATVNKPAERTETPNILLKAEKLKTQKLRNEASCSDVEQSDSGLKVEEVQVDAPVEEEKAKDETAQSKDKTKLKCNYCEKQFNSKQSKSMHIKAAHKGERPYGCKECDAKFGYPRSLALHMLSHRRKNGAKGYACDLCGKVLNHPSSVVYHKEAEHAGQRYVCNKCGKGFKHKQLLQRHQLVHSQLRPYTCKYCPSTFKTKANMLNHMLLHSGVKRFACNICKQKFAHKTSLTLHMRWHSGVKPFQCKYCDKSFSQKGNLSEHERIHTGERPHQCHLCSRSFTTSSQRRLHLQRHAQPRQPNNYAQTKACDCEDKATCPHKVQRCTVCDKLFASRPSLYKHCKQVHRLILMTKRGRAPPARPAPPPAPPAPTDDIIYVAYDFDNPGANFEILSADQTPQSSSKLPTNTIYSGSSLLVPDHLSDRVPAEPTRILNSELDSRIQLNASPIPLGANTYHIQTSELARDLPFPEHSAFQALAPTPASTDEIEDLQTRERIPVTDEQGNPLHFTMHDGTRLAITSIDGKSLQVVTQDGQTIPVEINSFGEEEEEEEEEIITSDDTIVHQLNLQKNDAGSPGPVTHYFTIV